MGYTRENYKGYGVTVTAADLPNLDEEDIVFAMMDFLAANYPLLSIETAGDTRDAEMEFIVVVTESCALTDETYSSYSDDDLYPEPSAGDASGIDALALGQLDSFILAQHVSTSPTWYTWSLVV